MLSPADQYFLRQEEPVKGCLLFLRSYILRLDADITEAWKYGMPFYYYRQKRFCYLWIHRQYQQPYLGIVDGGRIQHPGLVTEKRTRMKILLIDPASDIPLEEIDRILKEVISLYK